MALNIGHLFDAASSESEPEGDSRPLNDHVVVNIIKKTDELQKAAVEGIHLNHHLRNANEAIKAGKPPLGLIPKLNLMAYRGTKELQEAVDQEMIKAGLAVCSLLQQHFAKALKDSKEKIDLLNGELTPLTDSAEDEGYRDELKSRVQKSLNDIAKKCEIEAKNLAERSSRKRTREPEGPAEAPPKRARPTNGPPVLNTTLDRDTAKTSLFEVMNDVSDLNNIIIHSLTPLSHPQIRARLPPVRGQKSGRGQGPARGKGKGGRGERGARGPRNWQGPPSCNGWN